LVNQLINYESEMAIQGKRTVLMFLIISAFYASVSADASTCAAVTNCKTCDTDDTSKCGTCDDGYIVNTAKTECTKCETNCLTCTSDTVCTKCDNDAGTYLDNEDCKKCAANEYLDTSKSTATCADCDDSCLTCSGSEDTACLTCAADEYKTDAGKCEACTDDTTEEEGCGCEAIKPTIFMMAAGIILLFFSKLQF